MGRFDHISPKYNPDGYNKTVSDNETANGNWQDWQKGPIQPIAPPPPLPTGYKSPLLPGENPNTPAWFHNTASFLTTPLRVFFNNPFNQRAGQAGAEVITGQKFDSTPSTGSKVLDTGADILGGLMGFGVNPGGALNTGASAFKLGENALSKVPQLSKLPNFAQQGAKLASGSLAYDLQNSLNNGEPLNPKNMAIAAGENAALGLLPLGIGKGAEALKEARLPKPIYKPLGFNPLQDVQNAYKSPALRDVKQQEYGNIFADQGAALQPSPLKADNPSQYFGSTQADAEAAFPPRKLGQYHFTTGAQRAADEYNQGVQTAQNYVQHNDILAAYPPGTTIEQAYADVKANTGVDIPKLTENLLKAQNRTPLTPEQIRLGKVAGVIPDLKPRDNLKLTSPVEQPTPKQFPPQPFEPRTWTNREGIPTAPAPFQSLKNGELVNPPKPKLGLNPFEPKLQVAAAKMEIPEMPTLEADLKPMTNTDYANVKDITGFEGSSKDMYRILEQRLGKESADQMMDPFTQSKGDYIDAQNKHLGDMKSTIVDGLGIKKGSKESALVQKYGEGLITLDELKAQSPDKWQNIVKADQWFRDKYNQLIDQINVSKKEVYPNAEQNVAKIDQQMAEVKVDKTLSAAERQDTLKNLQSNLDDAMRNKIVPKRDDYYRHFQEMAQGLSGLKNIFENPTMIDPRLVGKTAWTKPRSKWASIAQQRLGNQTEYDAVGGFLNYLPQAAYAIHIDPHISRFRALSDEIANATVDTKNANNLINTLQNYANDLSGKTNPADRYMMENVPGGRTTVAALGWLQNRIKSNVILGNLGSAVSQVANVPNGIAFAKQYSAIGAAKTIKTILKPSQEMAQSPFLKERFGGPGSKVYQQFDTSLLNKPKQFATWVLETADKLGTEFIWNSAYAKGAAEGTANLVKYADDATRKLVAGRGIGEVPLMYKSKIFGFIAPFQLEVGNLWHIQKDMVSSKDFAGLATLYLSMYAFNQVSQQVKGSGVTFDPIQAVIDASQPGLTPLQRGGRLAGELLSNVPMGQNVAKLMPEYGGNVLGVNVPSRKALFGKNDPSRFGSGNLIVDAFSKPKERLLPPFGGAQIGKTISGATALMNQGVNDKKGNLMYPVSQTPANTIKGLMFGPGAFGEAQNYYSKDRRALTDKQTQQVKNSPNQATEYEKIQVQRKADSINTKITATSKDKTLSDTQRALALTKLRKQLEDAKNGK